jgi:DNA-binding FadR family transcriptional regulator
VSAARRVIAFLEDRRVLYSPGEMEMPQHGVHSVLEIRRFLSSELGKLDAKSEFAASLRAMRAACRKFLERVGTDGRR